MKNSAPKQDVSKLHADFFSDNNFPLVLLVVLVVALGGAMLEGVFYERGVQPVPQYFPTTLENRLIAPVPLSDPNISTPELLEWVVEAILESFSFNFTDYKKIIQINRKYYTNEGFQYYEKALLDTKTLTLVVDNKLVISPVPYSTPEIRSDGVSPNGIYTWQIRMPVLVTFQNAKQMTNKSLIVNMGIIRVPVTASPKGVAISAIIVREGRM